MTACLNLSEATVVANCSEEFTDVLLKTVHPTASRSQSKGQGSAGIMGSKTRLVKGNVATLLLGRIKKKRGLTKFE